MCIDRTRAGVVGALASRLCTLCLQEGVGTLHMYVYSTTASAVHAEDQLIRLATVGQLRSTSFASPPTVTAVGAPGNALISREGGLTSQSSIACSQAGECMNASSAREVYGNRERSVSDPGTQGHGSSAAGITRVQQAQAPWGWRSVFAFPSPSSNCMLQGSGSIASQSSCDDVNPSADLSGDSSSSDGSIPSTPSDMVSRLGSFNSFDEVDALAVAGCAAASAAWPSTDAELCPAAFRLSSTMEEEQVLEAMEEILAPGAESSALAAASAIMTPSTTPGTAVAAQPFASRLTAAPAPAAVVDAQRHALVGDAQGSFGLSMALGRRRVERTLRSWASQARIPLPSPQASRAGGLADRNTLRYCCCFRSSKACST